ncbi:MAG: penicillin-binding protein activator [Gammaproteobacteria bacterium]|nr:penicillin-binding protein activator [Gammaproteobacteria bacterium]
MFHRILPLLLVLASGCAPYSGPIPVDQSAQPAGLPVSDEPLVAAQQFLAAARDAAAPALAAEYRLNAAERYLQAGQSGEAANILAQVDATLLSDELLLKKQILVARIALDDGAPQKALQALQATPHLQVPAALKTSAYQLRMEAQLASGNSSAAVVDALGLEQSLHNPQALTANRHFIGSTLMQMSSTARQQLSASHRDPLTLGWIEFVNLHQSSDGTVDATALSDWRGRYPNHPARAEHLRRGGDQLTSMGDPPDRIALLLPFTSDRLAPAANAIHAGFMAAHFSAPAPTRPEILLFDSYARKLDELRQEIESSHADLLVGPLEKTMVQALLENPLRLPVLTLNDVRMERNLGSGQVIRFGLLPEADARAAAQLAILEGHQRAAVLASDDDWGTRLTEAFSETWQALGGTVVVQQRYASGGADYSAELQRMLLLDDSQARKQEMARALSARLQFTPRRRQDLDLIFLASYPREGRLLQPQLQFFHAADLPLYATSHIWTGQALPDFDRDLNKINFCTSPWQLEPENFPDVAQMMSDYGAMPPELAQLFVFGIDAYRLTAQLERLRSDPLARVHGATGSLGVDASGRIVRNLRCARFVKGVAQPLLRKQASEFDYGASPGTAPPSR